MRYPSWLLLLVPIVGVVELLGHWYFAAAAPRPPEWRLARPRVGELRKNGELVVIAPEWAEPLARSAFGEDIMPLSDLARPDSSAYRRAIEVSILGQRSSELERWRELDRSRFGRFELRLLENPHARPVRFSFVDHLEPGRVEVSEIGGGRATACAWTDRARTRTGGLAGSPAFPRERFNCAGGESQFVGVTVIDDQRYRPRRCIWANPRPEGQIRILYRRVPLGRTLRGYSGLPWMMTRDNQGPPIELRWAIDGQVIKSFSCHDGEGWKAFETAIAGPEGRIADVEFRVSAAAGASRQFCFYADLR
ncbi:MAG: hypothetical protein JW940_21460 [Polyangiaceae bacterium]|nr:hypothetical protein [Polyangiaceae bacterium]